MSEEFSFDIDLDEIDKLEVLDKMQKELEARHQRFMNGTETIDDLINHIYHYKIKNNDGLDLDLVEKKYYEKIVDLYNKEKEKNKQLFKEYNKRVSTIIKYEQTIKTAIDEFEDVLEE